MLLYSSLSIFLGLYGTMAHGLSTLNHNAATNTRESSSTTTSPVASPPPEPCTVRSPHSGAFFDLKPLNIPYPDTLSDKARARGARDYSWNATGWDMGYNFTLNFCGGVVEDLLSLGGVVGVEKELYRNVSAYYRKDGKVYSMGQQNLTPVIRGRKLVLNYTNGSPCEPQSSRPREIDGLSDREIIGGGGTSKPDGIRRKSTIISMLCEKDPLMPQLTLSFVAASQDECTYFFEARSGAACAGIQQAVQTLSPSGVFGVIVLIAFIVYLVGGCVYSRMVLQQRGWRQVPNYALWVGILVFFRDVIIILFSSCARCLSFGRHRGPSGVSSYSHVNGGLNGSLGGGRSGGGGVGGRDHRADAENRLIDELNEEWED